MNRRMSSTSRSGTTGRGAYGSEAFSLSVRRRGGLILLTVVLVWSSLFQTGHSLPLSGKGKHLNDHNYSNNIVLL